MATAFSQSGAYNSAIQCYIIDLLSSSQITFKLLPEELSESIGANWDTTSIRGRSAPFVGFNDVNARTISVSFQLHADYCDDILSTVNKIKALVYPSYSGSIVFPPKCYFRFGDMVKMYAVVESVSVSWQKPYIDNSSTYAMAEVSLELSQINSTPTNGTMISNGGNISR